MSVIANFIGTEVPLLISIVILNFKKDNDLIQGISKLDYLLKVSIFQSYKVKGKRDALFSVDTGLLE